MSGTKNNQADLWAERGRRLYHSLLFPPLVIFIAISVITFWSWRATRNTVKRDVSVVITDRENTIQDNIKQRLGSYEQILLGGAGLFRSSDEVTAEEWHNYVSTFDTANRYPGVQSIGYLVNTSPDQVDALIAYMHNQGFSNFTISPAGQRSNYTPILYLEPQSNGVGVDMSFDPLRLQALQAARDSGNPKMTAPTQAQVPNDDKKQQVFLLFAPQYRPNLPTSSVSERQAALQGYVYAGFRSNDFFTNMFRITNKDRNVAFRVSVTTDGKSQQLYQTPNYTTLTTDAHHESDQKSIELYGQTWNFDYLFANETLASAQERSGPIWIWVLGLTLGSLLALVIYLLLKTRSNELSQQKERAIDVAKDELLSLASHQLRTPATSVKQYLGMVLQGFAGDISPTQRKLLQNAYSGNERQLYIINEMLHVAKVDSGRITLARKQTDIVELVREVVGEQSNDLHLAGHILKTKFPKHKIMMNVDPHMLRMAIENLLSNAIKYTPTGGKITVSVSIKASRVRIAIQDTGVGIAHEDVPKLYKLFTRLDNDMAETVGGTGVGLYLAKHLVELHHGRIILESEPEHGSTFTISLPHKRGQQ